MKKLFKIGSLVKWIEKTPNGEIRIFDMGIIINIDKSKYYDIYFYKNKKIESIFIDSTKPFLYKLN